MMYNIIYCIDYYISNGGAFTALYQLIKGNKRLDRYKIFCRNYENPDLNIYKGTGESILNEYVKGKYDLIHWFHANGNSLFIELYKAINNKNISAKIITTICQQPDFKYFLLSPLEIKASDKLVFIDKTAYNNKLLSFVPNEKKSFIYFGVSKHSLEIIERILLTSSPLKNNIITYGRGSSLNKCPKDLITIYDKIDSPKKFIIIGDGDNKWLTNEINKRNDYSIILKAGYKYEEWLVELNKFDVFLYYLPLNAHSSIDGTLSDAMLLRKPIIYCGPEAPKERLVHGYNALIANNPSEIPQLCHLLCSNDKLKYELGKNARESTLKDFPYDKTVINYNHLYNKIFSSNNNIDVDIPLCYIFYYKYTELCKLLMKCVNKIHKLLNRYGK